MSEQDVRLKAAEMKIEQHEQLHQEAQDSIRVLRDGITQLVQAEIRREQDKETFKRMADEISETRLELKKLREEYEANKLAEIIKEAAAYKGIVLRLVGLAALVIASLIAGHYGSHLLG